MENELVPIAVTILGGYLGSGKTTRINKLLANWSGEPVAVVVNDFGAINIDASLIRSEGSDILELANGCVCCSLSDGMAAVMEQLAERRPRPAHVVIEVSGVGDPAGVAAWAGVPGFELNGILVCADVETIQARARDRWVADTVVAQLHSADIVALTKTDLVDDERTREVEEWLHTTIPDVRVSRDADALLALLSSSEISKALEAGRMVTGDAGDTAAHAHGHHDLESHRSWSASSSDLIDAEQVLAFLRTLPEAVVRGKGVLRTRQAPTRRTVLHLVGRRIEFHDDGHWDTLPAKESSLVLIASADPRVPEDLEDQMRSALAGSSNTN